VVADLRALSVALSNSYRALACAALCAVLAAACGGEKRTDKDAVAMSEPEAGASVAAGDRPIVKIEGGELVEPRKPGEARLVGVIGDSITQGGAFGQRYPRRLQKLLQQRFPGSLVEAHAVPGETCGELTERFEAQILAHRPAYDTVIVQCGLNDLHNGAALPRILRSIDTMVERAAQARMQAILLTAGPIWGHPGWTEEKEMRKVALNEWIMGRRDVIPVDTAAALAVGSPPRLRDEFVHVDHLHPNRDGLDEMARTIWHAAFAGGPDEPPVAAPAAAPAGRWQDVGPYVRIKVEH
jgi:lysophospholipase L1-like esterase